jgi:ATP synthase F1 delta subunit
MAQTKQYIAVRYAQAFLNLYGKKLTQEMYQALVAIQKDLEAQKKILFFFGLSMIPDDIKRSALERLCGPYPCGPHFKRLLVVLVESQRMHLLPLIIDAIVKGYRELHNYTCGDLYTSHALSPEVYEEIKKIFEKKLGTSLVLTCSVTPHLIAGIKLKTEDHMWEYSIDKQLRDIERSLSKGHA